MTKEKYEKPIMEVVDLKDDVILTSVTSGCNPDIACGNYTCTWDSISSCDYDNKPYYPINNTDSSFMSC
jgi:hypothetical protein